MTYIEQLRQSKYKAQVAFQEFALSTRKFPSHLFCFFEGKDNAYYIPRIKQFVEKYHPIKCGGRDKVLAVYKMINNQSEYERYKIAFFIDRDFNPPIEQVSPPIFETPCYSIENLYVSRDVFKDILTNEFHLSEVSDQTSFDACLSLYISRQAEFHYATTLFNAWYACLIEMRNTLGKQTGVNLDDKLPKGFVEISLQSITKNYDLEKIKETFPHATQISEELLNATITSFQNCDANKIFRGKYEMQFLLKFIQLLIQDSNSTQNILKAKANFAFGDNIVNQQAINIFEGYAETPASLVAYLQHFADK